MSRKVADPFEHSPYAPPVAQAAQIALVVLTRAQARTWNEMLTAGGYDHIQLTAEQQGLLEEHRSILPYLSRGGRDANLRTVLACPVCGLHAFMGTGTAPARCSFTLGCTGRPVRAPCKAWTPREAERLTGQRTSTA